MKKHQRVTNRQMNKRNQKYEQKISSSFEMPELKFTNASFEKVTKTGPKIKQREKNNDGILKPSLKQMKSKIKIMKTQTTPLNIMIEELNEQDPDYKKVRFDRNPPEVKTFSKFQKPFTLDND